MLGVFSMKPVNFPEGFVWGSATAGHQVEGDNIHSSSWHNEIKGHRRGRRAISGTSGNRISPC